MDIAVKEKFMNRLSISILLLLYAINIAAVNNPKDDQKLKQKTDAHHQKQDQQDKTIDQQAVDDYLQSDKFKEDLQQEFKQRAENKTAVDAKANTETEVHERICPLCLNFSVNCSADQERIRNGVVLTCGCKKCGGTGSN